MILPRFGVLSSRASTLERRNRPSADGAPVLRHDRGGRRPARDRRPHAQPARAQVAGCVAGVGTELQEVARS